MLTTMLGYRMLMQKQTPRLNFFKFGCIAAGACSQIAVFHGHHHKLIRCYHCIFQLKHSPAM